MMAEAPKTRWRPEAVKPKRAPKCFQIAPIISNGCATGTESDEVVGSAPACTGTDRYDHIRQRKAAS